MIRLRWSVLSAVVVVAAVGFGPAAQATTPVTITVGQAVTGQSGPGFAGFSYEKDRIGAGMFDARDTNLVNLFRLLGPSTLRLGGNLVDMVAWNSNGTGGSAKEIAPSDVDKLAGFVKATGWKVLYGINLKTNTPSGAADEAAYAAKALGSGLAAFEIGNEPNYYRSEPAYETSYGSYVKAIHAKVPTALFDGPGSASDTSWLTPFATHERANSLAVLSMHTYIGPDTGASISGMLASTAPGGTLSRQWSALAAAKAAGGIGQWRMTEANSYFHGGAAGVSDVQAAALWALDFMYGIASHDGAGVNFHGGTSTQFPLHYSPIVFAGLNPTGVQAVYYAELLWSLAGAGPVRAATVSGASSVSSWGIGGNVIVNNKGSSPLTATVRLATPASKVSAYPLTAPSLTSKAITIAGSGVTASAAFHPMPQQLTVSGGAVTVAVPAGSAVLVVTT
ncbi:glycosyl hydrolase family 79 C-terminal domain-containing protein [Kutzneria sp. NPDC051319]|uniref:glycosyl hydrolase family 79 C-terminal domain-containing protein n=1 Tax=Kutzneria sp. NPDC051319 TaxID=3155047 RepID=UPI003438CDF1